MFSVSHNYVLLLLHQISYHVPITAMQPMVPKKSIPWDYLQQVCTVVTGGPPEQE